MSFTRTFTTVDTHSGEPMRVITGGVPHIPGNTVYEQMKWLEQNDDQVRMLMCREPRGYPPMCVNLLVPLQTSRGRCRLYHYGAGRIPCYVRRQHHFGRYRSA